MLRRSARRISLACTYRPTTIPPLPRPVAHGQQLASPTTYACPPQPHSSRGLTSPHRNDGISQHSTHPRPFWRRCCRTGVAYCSSSSLPPYLAFLVFLEQLLRPRRDTGRSPLVGT